MVPLSKLRISLVLGLSLGMLKVFAIASLFEILLKAYQAEEVEALASCGQSSFVCCKSRCYPSCSGRRFMVNH